MEITFIGTAGQYSVIAVGAPFGLEVRRTSAGWIASIPKPDRSDPLERVDCPGVYRTRTQAAEFVMYCGAFTDWSL